MTDFFRDDFVGTGLLQAHTPNVGLYFGSAWGGGSTLNGSGQTSFGDPLLATCHGGPSPRPILTPPYTLEARFTFTQIPTLSPYDLYFEIDLKNYDFGSTTDVRFAVYRERTPTPHYVAYCYWWDRSSFTTIVDFSVTVPALFGSPNTVRIETDALGRRWYLNDVLVTSTSFVSVFVLDTVQFSSLIGGGGGGLIEYVGCSVPPPPVSIFWQDFDKTVETSAALLFSEPQTPAYVAPEPEPEPELAPEPDPPVIVEPRTMTFSWATFIEALKIENIANTMRNTTFDNVRLVTKLYGPIANWKLKSDSTTDIAGTIGPEAAGWSMQFCLNLPGGILDIDFIPAPHPSITSNPAYAAAVANCVGYYDTKPSAFTSVGNVHTMIAPGIAVTGPANPGNWNAFYGKSIVDVMGIEQYFELKPGASNTGHGYCGVTYPYWPGGASLYASGATASKLDEVRIGIWDLGADIADPAFNGSTMRTGVWAKRVGSTYETKFYAGGSLIYAETIGYTTGIDAVYFDSYFYSGPSPETGTSAWGSPYTSVNTNSSEAGYYQDDFFQTNLNNTKWAMYIIPAASNSAPWEIDTSCYMVTHPGYPLEDIAPAFWRDFDKTEEAASVFLFAEPQTPPYVPPELPSKRRPRLARGEARPKRERAAPRGTPRDSVSTQSLALTIVDSYSGYEDFDSPAQRVAFNSTGTYCAVGVMSYRYDVGDVYVFKLVSGHWNQVATLHTDQWYSYYEVWQVAIADNGTVMSIGSNSDIIHRWIKGGGDTWAADSWFYASGTTVANAFSYSAFALSADGNCCITMDGYSGGSDAKIMTGISGTKALRQTLAVGGTYDDVYMAAVFSADGKRLLVAHHKYSNNTTNVLVYTSTTLVTWTLAATVALPFLCDNFYGMRMTPDMNIVALGCEAIDGDYGVNFIAILQNTGGATYSYIGSYATASKNWATTESFGLATSGKLIAPEAISGTGGVDKLWSANDVRAVSGDATFTDQIPRPAVNTLTNWCTAVDLSSDGLWACTQGSLYDSATPFPSIYFYSVANFVAPSAFWQDFDKTYEVAT